VSLSTAGVTNTMSPPETVSVSIIFVCFAEKEDEKGTPDFTGGEGNIKSKKGLKLII